VSELRDLYDRCRLQLEFTPDFCLIFSPVSTRIADAAHNDGRGKTPHLSRLPRARCRQTNCVAYKAALPRQAVTHKVAACFFAATLMRGLAARNSRLLYSLPGRAVKFDGIARRHTNRGDFRCHLPA
jgi:hypothetical protein